MLGSICTAALRCTLSSGPPASVATGAGAESPHNPGGVRAAGRRPVERSSGGGLVDDEAEDAPLFGGGRGGNLDSIFARLENVRPSLLPAVSQRVLQMFLFTLLCTVFKAW